MKIASIPSACPTFNNEDNSPIIKIALICPTFNNEDLTLKCFKSISKYVLENEDITIIWVDNNSEFKSKKIVHEYLKSLQNIKFCNIFLPKNLGFIKAVNIGIKFCLNKSFNYIGIINNDIIASEEWLKNLYSNLSDEVMCIGSTDYTSKTNSINIGLMEKYPELKLLSTSSFEETCNNIKNSDIDDIILYDFSSFKNLNFISANVAYFSVLFNPLIFEKIGLLNEDFNLGYSDDTEFNYRITKAGFKIAKSLKSLVFHCSRQTFKKMYGEKKINDIQEGNRLQLKISKSLNSSLQKKYVIYTAIIDDYDSLYSPTVIDINNFDYICFTNSQSILKQNIFPWTIIDISKICEALNINDHVKWARYFKTHPHYFFENYEKSIWLDSNVDIIGDSEDFLNKLNSSYLLTTDHPTRNNIYEEISACNQLKKDEWSNLNNIQKFLINKGFPISSTKLIQSNIIAREHNNPKCKFLMEKWWEMIRDYSKRDQLSFNYVFWKYNGESRSIQWDLISMKYFNTDYKHGKE